MLKMLKFKIVFVRFCSAQIWQAFGPVSDTISYKCTRCIEMHSCILIEHWRVKLDIQHMASPSFTTFQHLSASQTIRTIQIIRIIHFFCCVPHNDAMMQGQREACRPSPSLGNQWRHGDGPVLFSFDSFDFRQICLDFVNRISRCIDLRSKHIPSICGDFSKSFHLHYVFYKGYVMFIIPNNYIVNIILPTSVQIIVNFSISLW